MGMVFPPQPTKDLEECHELSAGSGAGPRPKTNLVFSKRDRTPLIAIFVVMKTSCQQTSVNRNKFYQLSLRGRTTHAQ